MSGFYLSYPQAFCPLWVFSQPLSPLYPITFLRLGIQSNFLFLIPKVFLCSGYSYCFYFLYTQRFFFPWVFLLLFASLYPKIFLSMGILTAFAFSIPKDFLFHGYSYCFLLLYTQSCFFLWVYIRLLCPIYPNFYIHLNIIDAFPFIAPVSCLQLSSLLFPCDIHCRSKDIFSVLPHQSSPRSFHTVQM